MKLKTTIILLIIAAIGISYVFLYERKQLPHEEWERLQRKVLPDFRASMVKKIEVNNESGKIVMEKTADDYWYIVEPQRLRADNSEVNSILSEFEYMDKIGSFKREGEKPFDLTDYGLDTTKTSITMFTTIPAQTDKIQVARPRDKYTVFVGKKLAAGDNVYLKLDASDEVVVVPGTLYEKVNKNVLDLRSKWVFTFDKEAVESLQIKTNEHSIVCNRKGRFWRLVEPISDLADLEKIKEIIGKLKTLQVEPGDFLPETTELARYGLDNPRYTVTINEKGVSQSVLFGYSLDNKVYVKRTDEPTIFFLKDPILVDLSKKPNDLRDRKVVRFDAIGTYGINRLEVKSLSESVTIEKSLDLDWKITKPIAIYADQDTVKNFIEKMKTLEIADFVSDKPADLAAYGLNESAIEISLTKEDDKELAKFYVGKKLPSGDRCYVKRIGEEPVYTVPTVEFYDNVENVLLSFRDRLVSDFNRDLVKKLVIEKPDRTFVCDVTSKKDAEGQIVWELSKPVQTVADANIVNQIIWDMSFLKAENYVPGATKDLKAFGLDEPSIKVSVTYEKVAEQTSDKQKDDKPEQAMKEKPPLEKTVETRTLLIGKKVQDGDKVNSYCKMSDNDLIFELSWPKIRNFDAELVPAKVVQFGRTDVTKLLLGYPDRSIQLDKVKGVWKLKNYEKDVQGREVDYFVSNLDELRGSYIEQYKATNLTQFSLDNPQLVITLGLETGDAVIYIGKKKDANSYYVKSKDSDYIYVVDSVSVSKLMKKEVDFTTIVTEVDAPDAAKGAVEERPMGVSPHGKPHSSAPHGGLH